LDIATGDAMALGVVREEIRHRASDGASYSVFILEDRNASKEQAFGTLGKTRAAELASKLADTHVTVLELAATVDWLWRYEHCADWRSEIVRRKPMKVGSGRLDRAIALLNDLTLRPSESASEAGALAGSPVTST